MKPTSGAPVDRQADQIADILLRLSAIEKVGHIHASMDDLGRLDMFAWNGLPSTHLECVGGTVLIADYPLYAAKVGTLWGGNGTTTVGIPDMRGRGPIGRGDGDATGHTNRALGSKYGEQTHVLTAAETAVKGHSHTVTVDAVNIDHYHNIGGSTGGQSNGHRHGTSAATYYVYASPSPYTTIATDTGNVTLYLTYAADTGYNIEDHSHGLPANTQWQSSSYANHIHSHTGSVSALADGASGAAHSVQSPVTTVVLAIRVKL